MDTRTVDLGGLPEPIARGLEVVAEMARNLTRRPEPATGTAPKPPVWSLGVIGDLSREEIYTFDRAHFECFVGIEVATPTSP